MRNIILIATMIITFGGLLLTGCQTSSEKIDKAQAKVDDAKEDVKVANQELLAAVNDSIELFKKEALAKIVANEKSIAEFKARIASEKKEKKAEYEKTLTELEQKNTDLKMKLDAFKAEGKEKWESFKTEFSKDMEELGTAFVNFGTNSN